MSAIRRIEVFCDNCHQMILVTGTSVAVARQAAEKRGWRTRLKPSVDLPSEYDRYVDLCSICVSDPTVKYDKRS